MKKNFNFENFRNRIQKLEGNDREESADEDRMKGYYYQFKV